MKLKKYLFGIMAILLLAVVACNNEELKNPVLTDSDLTVYFWGEGDNVTGIAWEGYDVLIGETLDLELQVSPKADTDVKWIDDLSGDILSETLEYTYAPTKEESKRVNFIATRPSGFEKTIVFNFRGNLDGFTSKINQWQSVKIPEGTQTGTFTAEFDMIPSKDIMDGVIGILDGVSAGYSSNSVIVRLNSSGKIDAYNDIDYAAENELQYHAGMTYHVKIDVNAVAMTYDVFVTEQGGAEVVIAKDYKFRRKITHLDYWSMVAGDWNLDDPGTHRILNMQFTTHTQNEAPVFTAVDDIVMNEGTSVEVKIEAVDPLGGSLKLEAENLPRFATFVDNGFGKGLITFAPYNNCGGCDLGVFDIKITAKNSKETTDLDFKVEVVDPDAVINIPSDAADVDVFFGPMKDPAEPFGWTGNTELLVGGGVNWQDPADVYDMAAVMPFEIPEIPDGKQFATASFTANLNQVVSWAWQDYDLYGIPFRTSATVVGTDYYQGVYDGDPTSTAIQQKWAVKETPVGENSTTDAGNAALVDYLNAQLANGAKAGDFVFLRVSVSVDDAPTYGRIDIDSFESGNGPVLSVSFK